MKSKKFFSMILVLIMMLSTFLSTSGISFAAAMEGAGTEESPYLIRTVEDLYHIPDKPEAHYKLMKELDLGKVEREAMPQFDGSLDGNGFKIKNLVINNSVSNHVGLFSKISNAQIMNLHLDGVSINANTNYIGAFGGYSSKSKFYNCSVTNGTIKGKQYVGGMIGDLRESTLYQCYTKCDVYSETSIVGGLSGIGWSSEISECFTISNIYGTHNVGGILGGHWKIDNKDRPCTLRNSYAGGTVNSSGKGNTAGLYTTNNLDPIIINCYAINHITAANPFGLSNKGTPVNSYFDQEMTGINTPQAEARTTAQMYQKSNYENWDFEDIWTIEEGKDYPRLKFEKNTPVKTLKVVLELNEELQLSVDEELGENSNMIWTSFDETVATVDSMGVVKAIQKGNTTITAKSADGEFIMEIKILVVENAKEYRLAVDLDVGKSCRLTIDEAEDKALATWTSSDTSVATVTDKGRVTAVAKGLTLIQALDTNGEEIGQVYVRVRLA